MSFCREDTDFAVAGFYLEDLQIYFGRAVGHFSSANVETRVMLRALHVESVKAAFGKGPKPMGAKFLKAVQLIVDPGDCHRLPLDFDAQCFAIAQMFGVRNGNKDGLSSLGGGFGGKMKRILRSLGFTFVAADGDSLVVNETATQVTGRRQQHNADEGEKERH